MHFKIWSRKIAEKNMESMVIGVVTTMQMEP